MPSPVMNVIDQARWAFDRRTPVDGLLGILKQAMDRLVPEEIDLRQKFGGLGRGEAWKSEELYIHRHFQLSLFVLPRNQTIPLHGHPLMTVLMKVLAGAARVKAYDWAEEFPWSGLARPTYDRQLMGTDASLLILPKRGNIHSVSAIEDCAFVDLIYPPYSENDGRPCHYYQEADRVAVGGETFTRLVRG
jgi:2-aminoethanethiol dioxygenase/cysteine oxidase family protein